MILREDILNCFELCDGEAGLPGIKRLEGLETSTSGDQPLLCLPPLSPGQSDQAARDGVPSVLRTAVIG